MSVSLLSPRFDVPVTLPVMRRYWRWATASVAVHVALLGFCGSFAVVRVGEPRPLRITIFEPPAPPPPPPGGVSVLPAVPAPVAQPVPEPVRPPVEKPRPQKIAAAPERAAKPRPRPRLKPDAAPPPEPFPSPAAVAAPLGAGAPAGEAAGTPGGVVGGIGTRVLRADEVASPPVVISSSMPVYPPLARARGIEGLVVLETIVDRRGRVEADSVRVVESVPLLDDAAIAALRQWRFRPGQDAEGEAVRVLVHLPVRFRLR